MIAFRHPNMNMATATNTARLYWVAMGLFTLLFGFSVVLTLFDLSGSYENYAHLGFPSWTIFFNATAKILGLFAVFQTRWQTLKDFAFAGFLFDLLLAFGAHAALQEADIIRPIVGLIIWVFAFTMDRRFSRENAA